MNEEKEKAEKKIREDDAQFAIEIGLKHPYNERKPVDNAEIAVLGILANLCDRRGIKNALGDVDFDVREEIVTSLAAIIRKAQINQELLDIAKIVAPTVCSMLCPSTWKTEEGRPPHNEICNLLNIVIKKAETC
jgi:hypothetical protein